MKILLAFFCFSFNFISAQEIAIPYRDGKSWGVSNEKGIILIEPKYDSMEFIDDGSDTHEIIIPRIKDKRGLIIKGKLIFEAIYDNIYEKNGNYVLIKTDSLGKTTDYVNRNGKSLLSHTIIEIIDSKNIQGDLTLFHVLNKDFTESIFILNQNNQEIINLYEHYFSLKLLDKIIELNSVPVLVKKSEKDDLSQEVWDFTKLPNEKVKVNLTYRNEIEYQLKFIQKSDKYRNNNYDSYGVGSGDISVEEVRDYKDYSDVTVQVEDAPIEKNTPKIVYYNITFKKENNRFYVIKTPNFNSKEIEKREVKLKSSMSSIEVKNAYHTSIKNDTVRYYNSILTYRSKGKFGFLFTEDIQKRIEFDTILNKTSWKDSGSYTKEVIMIVGNKDKTSKKMKYNFYSNLNGFVYPTFFDEIYTIKMNSSNDFKIYYFTKLNTKLGLVTANGTEILKPEFDKITEMNSSSYSYRSPKLLFAMQKNKKHGLVYQNSSDQAKIINPLFDYPVKQVIENYPKRKHDYSKDKSGFSESYITLLLLQDEEGKFIGYANANGMLYFKN